MNCVFTLILSLSGFCKFDPKNAISSPFFGCKFDVSSRKSCVFGMMNRNRADDSALCVPVETTAFVLLPMSLYTVTYNKSIWKR